MKILALICAALAILAGLVGVVFLDRLMELAKFTLTPGGIYAAAIARIVLGVLLFAAAKATRTPKTIRVIAVIILVAGVATALISIERGQMLRDWWLGLGADTFRIAACVPVAVGFFIAGSALSRRA